MIEPSTVSDSDAFLPLQLAVSALGGAVVAGLAGLLAAWLQRRGEHQHWLRQERLRGYVAVQAWLTELNTVVNRARELRARYDAITTVRSKVSTQDGSSSERAPELVDAMGKALIAELDIVEGQVEKLTSEVSEATAPLIVLGPKKVEDAADALTDAVGGGDAQAISAAQDNLKDQMRRALRIPRG